MDLIKTFSTIVRDILDDQDLEITTSTCAGDIPGWDSLSHARIIASFEKKIGKRVPTGKVLRANSVGELLDLYL